MVIGVLEVRLHQVVVHVADRQLGPDPGDADGLEFEVGHGARGVLGQGLVDAQSDLLPLPQLTRHQMVR